MKRKYNPSAEKTTGVSGTLRHAAPVDMSLPSARIGIQHSGESSAMNSPNALPKPLAISDGEAGMVLFMGRSARARLESDSDATLVRLAQAGDDEALDVLLRRHQKTLLARARRHCGNCGWVEDLCQETCRNLVFHLPNLREPDAFAGWMQAHLMHHTNHCRRKNCKKVRTRTDEDGTYLVEGLSVEAACVTDMDWWCLWDLLWQEAGDIAGQRGRVAAFMLEHYTRQESFPSVHVIVQALKISHWSAQKCRFAALLTWRQVLRAAEFYP